MVCKSEFGIIIYYKSDIGPFLFVELHFLLILATTPANNDLHTGTVQVNNSFYNINVKL